MTPRIYRNTETRYTHVTADGEEVTIWSNPGAPSVTDIMDGTIELGESFRCPNPDDPRGTEPDGCTTEWTVDVDRTDEDALDTFIDHVRARGDGTVRCNKCGEPVYGIIGEGDAKAKRSGRLHGGSP